MSNDKREKNLNNLIKNIDKKFEILKYENNILITQDNNEKIKLLTELSELLKALSENPEENKKLGTWIGRTLSEILKDLDGLQIYKIKLIACIINLYIPIGHPNNNSKLSIKAEKLLDIITTQNKENA